MKLFAVAMFFVIFICLFYFIDNRLMEIMENIGTATNIFDAIFYADASGGFRALFNCLYYLSVFVEPFGFGLGILSANWFVVANCFNINPFDNEHLSHVVENINNIDAQAYIPNAVGNVGIFTVFLIFFIFKGNIFGDTRFKFQVVAVLIMFMFLLQSNFANPVFWILIAFLKYNSSCNKKCFVNLI